MRQRGGSGRSRRGVRHGRVGRGLLQGAPAAEGPGDDHGPAHHLVLGDGAAVVGVLVGAGVGGVRPVVAHHPQPSLGHGDVERDGGRGVAGVKVVALLQRDTVDRDPALLVAALDLVAADADDPLDEVLVVLGRQQSDEGEPFLDLLDADGVVLARRGLLGRQPAAGVLEDDHVAALRPGPEPGCELVDQDPVADLDRLFHRAGRDDEGLDEERLEHQRDQDGDTDQEGDLLDGAAPAAPLDLALEFAPLGAAASGGGAGRPA
ncbi:hypothetical protein SUDANB132_01937 [Streptomyces sp. enrichment culture]